MGVQRSVSACIAVGSDQMHRPLDLTLLTPTLHSHLPIARNEEYFHHPMAETGA